MRSQVQQERVQTSAEADGWQDAQADPIEGEQQGDLEFHVHLGRWAVRGAAPDD